MVGLDRSGLKHNKTGEPKSLPEMVLISVDMAINVTMELKHSLSSLVSSYVHTLPFPTPAESETLGENHSPNQGSTDITDRQKYRPFETYVPESVFNPRIAPSIRTNVSQNAIPWSPCRPCLGKCSTLRSGGNRTLGRLAKT